MVILTITETRHAHFQDEDLCPVIGRCRRRRRIAGRRVARGLIEAEIGKFLLKLRVARPGEGRSGGYRVILVYKAEAFAVFVHMFAKKAQANLTSEELESLRSLAKLFVSLA